MQLETFFKNPRGTFKSSVGRFGESTKRVKQNPTSELNTKGLATQIIEFFWKTLEWGLRSEGEDACSTDKSRERCRCRYRYYWYYFD